VKSGYRAYFDIWRADRDLRTVVGSAGSFAATAAFALYNGFLGLKHASLWHGTICVYYMLLSAIRGPIVLSEAKLRRGPFAERKKLRVYRAASWLLLLLNMSLVVPISLMTRMQKPVSMTLIPAIAMAAYTTYKITMASIDLRRRKRTADMLVRLLRTLRFIDAQVSILTLQNTLIMVNTKDGSDGMLPLTALTSGAIFLSIMILSASTLVRGYVRARD